MRDQRVFEAGVKPWNTVLSIYIVTVRCIKTLHTLYTGTGAPVACMRSTVSGGTVSLSVRRAVHRVAARVVAKIYRPLIYNVVASTVK